MPYKEKGRKKPYRAQKRINGKTVRRSFSTQKEARQWEAECQGNIVPLTVTISLGEWAVKYMNYAERFVQKTYLEKRLCFRTFFKVFDRDLQVKHFTSEMAMEYLSKQNADRSGNCANKDRKNLVAAWNWGIKYVNAPQQNPFLSVDRFPEQRKVRHMPTEDDFWKAWDAAKGQDKVMLLAYLHLGARRSELFRLRWEDVDFAGSKVRLFCRKNRQGTWESAWLPMTDDLFNALLDHKKEKATDLVFPNPETGSPFTERLHYMGRLCKRAGVKPFGFHAIRHLTASILAKHDVPLMDIQAILRHSNLTTTQKYIRRIDTLKTAVTFLPSRNKKPPKSPLKMLELKTANAN